MTKRKHDVIIVGSGLFGSMAARFAYEEGHRVTVIDARKPFRASPCSGCVIAPSWLTALTKTQIADGRALLDMFYGLEELEFNSHFGATFKAERVPTDAVLKLPSEVQFIEGEVLSVFSGGLNWQTATGTGTQRGKVLVAAGIWCSELISGLPAIRGLYGASLRVSGQIPQPRLSVYAPYRQAVAFNMTPKTVWFGDGTALIETTWRKESDNRVIDTIKRMRELTGIQTSVRSLTPVVGARPYMKGHMGYYRQINNSLYVSTGGAKNGTILAALQAQQFITDLRSAK